jgi:hypothetical protein
MRTTWKGLVIGSVAGIAVSIGLDSRTGSRAGAVSTKRRAKSERPVRNHARRSRTTTAGPVSAIDGTIDLDIPALVRTRGVATIDADRQSDLAARIKEGLNAAKER